jgi:hypothetical protein
MNPTPAELIARAVLYEGYILYPYRPGAIKNRYRWALGGLAPRVYAEARGEPWSLQAECLVAGDGAATLSVRVRFLHPLLVTRGGPSWQEATEQEVVVPDARLDELAAAPRRVPFDVPPSWEADSEFERTQHAIEGTVEVAAARVGEGVFRVTARVANLTPLDDPAAATRDEAVLRSLAAAHVVLHARGGEFVSTTDPAAGLRALAGGCRNVGVWPVLVGEPGRRDTVLAPPIILADYPEVAPESPGDFFDGTEIDELLALRVLTLTDGEKREVAAADPRARALLERVDGLSDSGLAGLHGAVRSARPAAGPRPGDRVRLRPRGRADALDLLLAGKTATVVSVEHDAEGAMHLAVTVDDDPGRDLGETGMPGHRFFFRPEEVEPLPGGERS